MWRFRGTPLSNLPPVSARAFAVTMAVLAVLAAPAGAPAQTPSPAPQTNLADVEDEVMCPICGTLLELSESPQAQRERTFIRELIARGETKEGIKDALVAEFGPEVLALPEGRGFDLAAWIVPGAGIALAAVAILIGLRRWRRQAPGDGNPPVPETLPSADEERLDADLARYDL